ncbi:hypothetical protein KGF54_001126 [Candida jiufengensis]|uniref:uncharacterized protein n=1 Tax=Candida jiufengensis TaxID=497108 RepID=UPI00222423CE|nr:uncharacterized protein KGF54_001126 [Candida jiufengensis]KAI5955624.1 hypothetical protein KGF54_001126 [Candida jiufengensis]
MRNETSPLLSATSSHDENEVISYVKSRRQSIQSMENNKIPDEQLLHSPRHLPSLYPVTSNNSIFHYPISEILSNHELELNEEEPKTSIYNESKILVLNSIPLIITFFLQYSLNVTSIISVGKLGSKQLAAISLSTMTANISGLAIIQGISTCLDTLCAQSYGKKDFNSVGVHFLRCNYFIMLLFIPIWLFWVFGVKDLLILIIGNDEKEICELAGDYLKVLSFGLPGFILFENGKHFLQAQGIFHASTYILFISLPLNIAMNYVLVWTKFGFGFIGAPLAIVLTNWLMFILLYCYIFFINGYQCWPKQNLFNKIYFQNWTRMINLAIPGVVMVEAEWLAFEIITFEAAKFGEIVLAAQSIISTILVLFYQVSFALGITASIRTALLIGGVYKESAKKATFAAIYTSLVFGCINCFMIYKFRYQLASIFSSDKKVIELASTVLIIGAVYQINDLLTCSLGGVLRGQARQSISGWLNIIGYYFIALPIAYYLAFIRNWQLVGLWTSLIIALSFVSFTQLYFVLRSNWDEIIDECINEAITEEEHN